MEIEYEATFTNIDKEEMREKLKKAGAQLVKPEFLQKRVQFNPPNNTNYNKYLRVRDEEDKITMSIKHIDGDKIENQKEICLIVDDFKKAESFLISIGCRKKAYYENKREIWKLNDAEITIDEWPFLEPFVEIESDSEESVKKAAEILGFDYSKALFCSAGKLYSKKYKIHEETVSEKTPLIIFNMKNPFTK